MDIGVEIEIKGASQSSIERLIPSDIGYEIHNDGSLRRGIEFYVRLDGFGVVDVIVEEGIDVPSFIDTRRPAGFELVIHKGELSIIRDVLEVLSRKISHIDSDIYSSIHFHLDVKGKPWVFIRDVLKWSYYLEAILYRLSCAGRVHRGESIESNGYSGYRSGYTYSGPSNHRFARPLSNPIGAIDEDGDALPLFDIENVLNSKSATEFLYRMGNLYYYAGGTKYIPHRLHSVNICPVLYQGSVEFRLFDSIYRYLPQMMDVCVAIFELAENSSLEEKGIESPMVLGSEYEIGLEQVRSILNIDIPRGMWGERWVKGLVSNYPISHYGDFSLQQGRGRGSLIANNVDRLDTLDNSYSLFE